MTGWGPGKITQDGGGATAQTAPPNIITSSLANWDLNLRRALYQVNFQVPANTPNGDLQLVLTQTGGQSNTTILAVHN